MPDTPVIAFTEIVRRVRAAWLPDVDCVVGVATGGVAAASAVAFHLDKPLYLLTINYRDPANQPRYDAPRLLGTAGLPVTPQRVLLVDDVAVTGATLRLALAALAGHSVQTLVCKGSADYVLFPELDTCVVWPWSVTRPEAQTAVPEEETAVNG